MLDRGWSALTLHLDRFRVRSGEVLRMRKEIPLSVAVVVIVVFLVLVVSIGWWLTTRRPQGGGVPPREYMGKPPYALERKPIQPGR